MRYGKPSRPSNVTKLANAKTSIPKKAVAQATKGPAVKRSVTMPSKPSTPRRGHTNGAGGEGKVSKGKTSSLNPFNKYTNNDWLRSTGSNTNITSKPISNPFGASYKKTK